MEMKFVSYCKMQEARLQAVFGMDLKEENIWNISENDHKTEI